MIPETYSGKIELCLLKSYIKELWWYYYLAVDKYGDIVDFYLSQTRNEKSRSTFLRKAIGTNRLSGTSLLIKAKSMLKHFII